MDELERLETGGLSVGRVDDVVPSSLRLLAALLPHLSMPGVLQMEMFLFCSLEEFSFSLSLSLALVSF